MSVRATDSLIADPVVVSAIPGAPSMIVRSVDPDKKLVTTIWFAASGEKQEGVFPAGALDRAEAKAPKAKGKAPKAKAPKAAPKCGRGRK